MSAKRVGQLDGRVLLLVGDGPEREWVLCAARRAGAPVARVPDAATLAQEIVQGAAAAVVDGAALEDGGIEALGAALSDQESWSDLPIVVLCRDPPRCPGELAPPGHVIRVPHAAEAADVGAAIDAALRARARQYAARDRIRELSRALDTRDEFLAMLGHELRNPLGAILLAVPLLRAGDPERPQAIIERQSRRLARLVDDLLEVSRVTRGNIALRRETVDLNAIVGEAAAGLAEAARLQKLDLSVALWREPVLIHGDPVRVEQIVANLLANALKYTPAGGRVSVAVGRDGGSSWIRVVDDGIGIEPEMLEHIFEPFTQAATTIDRAQGGLGLGLALVKRLVALHGGTVEARSDGPGTGSAFEVRLPLAAVVRAVDHARVEGPCDAGRLRVLVVEDNEDNRDALKLLVEHLGHDVDAVEDGLRGVARALTDHPDVMLVDIGLPGLDGYEVARRVRGALGAGVKLVAVTGYGQPEDRRRAIAAGFDQHLTKPVDFDTLGRVFRNAPRPMVN